MSEQHETPREGEEREADEEEPMPNVGTDPMDTPEQGKKKQQVAPDEEAMEDDEERSEDAADEKS